MMRVQILALRWRMMFECKLTRDCDGCSRFDKCFDEKQDEIESLLKNNWSMTIPVIRIVLD